MLSWRAACRYACYYLTRNSLTYTAPVMVSDPSLNMDITQIGSLTSLFPIAYGFSKFVSGVLGARTSPTLMLAGGLMATAAVNLLFGAGNALPWFLTFWAINGILQARAGWPRSAGPAACADLPWASWAFEGSVSQGGARSSALHRWGEMCCVPQLWWRKTLAGMPVGHLDGLRAACGAGCVQGFGGPCCARILTSWFATKERGTYWGMWNIAHNLGGFGAPLLAGTAARYYGWKWGAARFQGLAMVGGWKGTRVSGCCLRMPAPAAVPISASSCRAPPRWLHPAVPVHCTLVQGAHAWRGLCRGVPEVPTMCCSLQPVLVLGVG